MDDVSGLLPRRILEVLRANATVEPVIALHGPRAAGKSTVLQAFARGAGVPVVDLDDVVTREAAAANPSIVVAGSVPLCLDEYQYAPVLLDSIKARLNAEGSLPGTAVITGSTRQDALPRTAQALTGRLHTMNIWPLSQGEIGGVRENLIESLRIDPVGAVGAVSTSATLRAEYVERVLAGGFPMAHRRSDTARARWFDDYTQQSLHRDAVELHKVRHRDELTRLFDRLAGQTGQVLNASAVSGRLSLDPRTVNDYIQLLEDLFLVKRLPAWGKTLMSRATKKPKLHVVDSGLAARRMRVSAAKLATLDATALTEFGSLMETFVVGELTKQVSWLDEAVTVGHWRTHDGDEVDCVLEFDDGRVLAFEVKANERIGRKDFDGLAALRDALGDRFTAGIAFSTGSRSYTYDDRLHVLPVDRLWTPVS